MSHLGSIISILADAATQFNILEQELIHERAVASPYFEELVQVGVDIRIAILRLNALELKLQAEMSRKGPSPR